MSNDIGPVQRSTKRDKDKLTTTQLSREDIYSNTLLVGLHTILCKMKTKYRCGDDLLIYDALVKAYNDEELMRGVVLMAKKHNSIQMGFALLNKVMSKFV